MNYELRSNCKHNSKCWVILLSTYLTKHFPSNPILLPFFFKMVGKNHLHHPRTPRNVIKHVIFSISVGSKKWTLFPKSITVCNDTRKKRRRKFHAFNKKNSFILLRYAHSLLYFTKLLCSLFMIIYYLSLYLFVSHFSSLLYANLFFCIFVHFFSLSFSFSLGVFLCQYYASTHLKVLFNFLFFIYSFSFSLNFYWVFFRGVREEIL